MGDSMGLHRHQLEQSQVPAVAAGKSAFEGLEQDEIHLDITQTDGSSLRSDAQGQILSFEEPRVIWQVQSGVLNGPASIEKGELYVVIKSLNDDVFVQDYFFSGFAPCWFGAFPVFPDDRIIIEAWTTIGATNRKVRARVRHTPI